MDTWYNKFKSNEIVLSDRKPDVGSIPEDAPAGAFSRIQKRQWKLWLVVDNLYNPTSVKHIFVRSGAKNDWVEYIPPTPISTDDWKLLGNTGTNPSINFLGTTDAQRLVFRTNNTEKATILTNGSVGIGTTTPTSSVHTNGSIASNATVITATYTATATDNTIICNNAATNITITLPDPTTCLGREYNISRYAGSTGTIKVTDARGAAASVQALGGTLGVTTTLSGLGANENWNGRYKAVTVGLVTSWLRID